MTIELAPPWRYSTLHRPGYYRDRATGKVVFWSGTTQDITTWQQAEWNAAAQMRALGYLDAEVTPPGADRGVDVKSSKALAQVKREQSKAGRPDMQRLYGARGSDRNKELWFFAELGYAWPALEYADKYSILLFTFSRTGELTPVNKIARTTFDRQLARRDKRIERRKASRAQQALAREARLKNAQREEIELVAREVVVAVPLAPVIPTGAFSISEEVA